MRILAIIPARGGSKRLPGKNIKPFLGKPLIGWTADFCRTYQPFTKVVVSTDDERIATCARSFGIDVPWLRSVTLATDTATSVDVAIDMIMRMEECGHFFDAIALLQPTSPIRFAERWDQAIALLTEPECDAVISVGPTRSHPWITCKITGNTLEPWDTSKKTPRSQDFPPAYVINGALYLIKKDVLLTQKTFFPLLTKGVISLHPGENIDIDTELDWVISEAIVNHFKDL